MSMTMTRSRTRTMDEVLPLDLVNQILLRLPVKSLVRFRLVSRDWRRRIDDPVFIRGNYSVARNRYEQDEGKQHSFLQVNNFGRQNRFRPVLLDLSDPEEEAHRNVVVDGSDLVLDHDWQFMPDACFGFFCFFSETLAAALLWNPATKQRKRVPFLGLRADETVGVLGYGVGCVNNVDFRIVRLVWFKTSGEETNSEYEFQVFVLSTKSWRRIEISGSEFDDSTTIDKIGVELNGKIYWSVAHYPEEQAVMCAYIVTLNMLKEEDYKAIMCPSLVRNQQPTLIKYCHQYLGLIATSSMPNGIQWLELWVLRNYENDTSWDRQVRVHLVQGLEGWLGYSHKLGGMIFHVGTQLKVVLPNSRQYKYNVLDAGSILLSEYTGSLLR